MVRFTVLNASSSFFHQADVLHFSSHIVSHSRSSTPSGRTACYLLRLPQGSRKLHHLTRQPCPQSSSHRCISLTTVHLEGSEWCSLYNQVMFPIRSYSVTYVRSVNPHCTRKDRNNTSLVRCTHRAELPLLNTCTSRKISMV